MIYLSLLENRLKRNRTFFRGWEIATLVIDFPQRDTFLDSWYSIYNKRLRYWHGVADQAFNYGILLN
jgi:hypothetical protein